MSRRRAVLALVLVCPVWGISFTAIKQALAYTTPLVLLALRFSLATLVIAGALRGLTRSEAAGGLVLGGLFWAGFVLQTTGLQYTTPSRSAFLTILSTPLVPVLQFVVHRTVPRLPTLLATRWSRSSPRSPVSSSSASAWPQRSSWERRSSYRPSPLRQWSGPRPQSHSLLTIDTCMIPEAGSSGDRPDGSLRRTGQRVPFPWRIIMRVLPCLFAATTATALLACDKQADSLSPDASQIEAASEGFVTSHPAFARPLLAEAHIKPIISVGDPIPGQGSNPDPEQRVWAPIPDGLGATGDADRLVLFANHELTSGGVDGKFPYARVSRLVIDPSTLKVMGGSYSVNGRTSGFLFQRLCSATFVGREEGFGSGWFFTGEESTSDGAEGLQLAVTRDGSEIRKLPWLGRFAHENYIAVPGFKDKVVMIGTDDTSPSALGAPLRSELYMYVARTAEEVLSGDGRLLVFKTRTGASVGGLRRHEPVTGRFVEVEGAGALSAADLQARVDQLSAFKFVRLEDVDYARGGSGADPVIYFVDTGNANARCGAGACDLYGSIYRMTLDAAHPHYGARLELLDRSRGVERGDWASPDNIAVSSRSLMLQEDPAYAEFNRAERIWNFSFREDGTLRAPRAVAELKTRGLTGNTCNDAAGTCWESSGIIEASKWLGDGTWLFDVQAHTLPFSYRDGSTTVSVSEEGGQLLFLRLSGS